MKFQNHSIDIEFVELNNVTTLITEKFYATNKYVAKSDLTKIITLYEICKRYEFDEYKFRDMLKHYDLLNLYIRNEEKIKNHINKNI